VGGFRIDRLDENTLARWRARPGARVPVLQPDPRPPRRDNVALPPLLFDLPRRERRRRGSPPCAIAPRVRCSSPSCTGRRLGRRGDGRHRRAHPSDPTSHHPADRASLRRESSRLPRGPRLRDPGRGGAHHALHRVFIAGNIAAFTIRERAREIAVLKAPGFPRCLLFAVLLGQALVLCGMTGARSSGLAVSLSALLRHAAGWIAALARLDERPFRASVHQLVASLASAPARGSRFAGPSLPDGRITGCRVPKEAGGAAAPGVVRLGTRPPLRWGMAPGHRRPLPVRGGPP